MRKKISIALATLLAGALCVVGAAAEDEIVAESVEEEVAAEAVEVGFATAEEAVASIEGTAIAGYTFVEGSEGFGNEGAENLWDGNVETKFCTNIFPICSVVELDAAYSINGIVMATANDNAEYNGRLPMTWTISGSVDGENWTVIAEGDSSFFEEANFTYFAAACEASEAVTMVKFESEGAESGCFQISEVVLCGAEVVVEEETVSTKVSFIGSYLDFIGKGAYTAKTETVVEETVEEVVEETVAEEVAEEVEEDAVVEEGFVPSSTAEEVEAVDGDVADLVAEIEGSDIDVASPQTDAEEYVPSPKADDAEAVDGDVADLVDEINGSDIDVTSPQTFDVAVIAAVAAVISGAGYAVAKKKNH